MEGADAVEMAARAHNDPSWLAGMEVALVPSSNLDGCLWSETSERFWPKNSLEPESQALGSIIESGLTVHVDVHAYSELIRSPWAYTTKTHVKTYQAGDNLLY